MTELVRLFQPGRIGKMEVKNRLVMAAMGTHACDDEGYQTDRVIDYYVERARGGVGLIMNQGSFVAKETRAPHMAMVYDDRFIPGLRKLTEAVHQHGAKIACQLAHFGVSIFQRWVGFDRPADIEAVGPSAVPCPPFGVTPRELTREELHYLVEAYAQAAVRAQKAGFDAVEIHGCHGYFLGAFFSPFKNRRQDEYGGSPENRARFSCEIVARTRQKVGPDFPILFRMNGSDFFEGGTTLDDALIYAPMLVRAGADALDISAGTPDDFRLRDLTYLYPDAAIVPLAAAIKKVVKVPVIAVGKIGDPILAEGILAEGKADFIAMGRALLVDPELPNKAREGRLDEIHRCIYCNNCRVGFVGFATGRERIQARGGGLWCTVNPALLREREFELRPAPRPKKVMVIGGGLAGMEAARTLAQRGHRVTLYEKGDRLGGQWNIACQQPGKEGFASLSQRLIKSLEGVGVKVNLKREVNRQLVAEEKPEAVVVATGAIPKTLEVPGAGGKNVVQAVDIIRGRAAVGDTVVVVGGRLIGMEMAERLARQGKKVSLVTKNRLGENGGPLERNLYRELRDRLIDRGVRIYANAPVHDITDDGVHIIYEREMAFLAADSVVLAVGAQAENRLVEELKGLVPEVHAVGDCLEPRDARLAVNEGAEVGRLI